MENIKVYMATVITEAEVDIGDSKLSQSGNKQEEIIIVARNLKQVEALLEDNQKLQRVVIMANWIIADTRESYSGNYYMVDTIFESPVTAKEENIIYLVQGNNFTEVEEITREEAGSTFEYIQSVEAIPYAVYK